MECSGTYNKKPRTPPEGDASLSQSVSDPSFAPEDDPTPDRSPPRKRSLLLLGLTAITGIVVGLSIVYFLFLSPMRRKAETPSPQVRVPAPGTPAQPEASGQPSPATLSTEGLSPSDQPPPGQEGRAEDETKGKEPPLPLIDLPAGAGRADLEAIIPSPVPYTIYAGAYRGLQEAETTQRELRSNYLSAYIVPVRVEGNIAQSLFGVTQDGTWYLVLTGHYVSKDQARQSLGRMTEELPGYQPEIMRFPFAIECGRFLVQERAGKLMEQLTQAGLFPYSRTYPTGDGRVLTRVLVGCYYSQQGAQPPKKRLEEKGFPCRIVER
jgi:cell division septation protein DedD